MVKAYVTNKIPSVEKIQEYAKKEFTTFPEKNFAEICALNHGYL